ncbi:ankyrin repeat domain-containing protein SOWAHC [Gastrophryne carolinensis]
MPEISRDSVVRFLQERGGRVPNQRLVEHFRPLLSGESGAATRQQFKDIVNEVASVRVEDGAKYVCLRKRYRRAEPGGDEEPGSTAANEEPSTPGSANEEPGSTAAIEEPGSTAANEEPSTTGSTAAIEPGSTASSTRADEATAEELKEPDIPVSAADEWSEAGSPESPQTGLQPPPIISVTDEPQPPVRMGGRTPRSSRRGAREAPVSPQLRPRREADRSSLHSSSSVSGNEEDEATAGGPVSLEPLEHAWMLSSCRGRWEPLRDLLASEPGLIPRRDFITGFSCLHWAAKHGQHELLVTLLGHARRHGVPININARASGGYTALHLAAMHGHLEVIKLLVGAYDADLDIRDYSGRKAWQYLSPDTARDVQALVGAAPEEEEDGGGLAGGRWRLSRVLPSQLIVHRLSQFPEDEQDGSGRGRGDISRKGSGGSRGKPRLNKIRFRTQIIHTNLREPDDDDEENRVFKSPMRHRPKSNVFG